MTIMVSLHSSLLQNQNSKIMKILKIEDYNYSIIYVENNNESLVYKRFNENKWMQLNSNHWSIVKNFDELEKAFKQKKDDYLIN